VPTQAAAATRAWLHEAQRTQPATGHGHRHLSRRVTTTVELAGGDIITASITKEAADELGLAAGSPVTAVVKASDVIVAVE